MDELLKIAPNGQWTLGKSTSKAYGLNAAPAMGAETPNTPGAPRVTLYRGMNGVTAKDLAKYGITAEPNGGVHHTKQELSLKQHGWWNDDPRWGLMYSAYDHQNKKPSKEPTYDMFMVGEADHPGGDKNITHALREKNSPVTLHRIVYAPSKGSSDDRWNTIKNMTPDINWPPPKGSTR